MSAVRVRLGDGRWHFQHGPIDCIVHAEGEPAAVARATDAAWQRFTNVLDTLVAELPLLRADLSRQRVEPHGEVARTMVDACAPHGRAGRFVTAMAAVAGSVADHLVAPFSNEPGIERAYVNNGGDIALHLAPGAAFAVGICADLERGLAGHAPDGRFTIHHATPVRGIATSGWRGRSFSLGIADAVTVLAATGARADAGATIVANAVDVDAPGVVRRPAGEMRDGSDLGDRRVTVAVGPLSPADVERALDAGARTAHAEIAAGRIVAAVLQLAGHVRVCGEPTSAPAVAMRPRLEDMERC